MNWLINIIDTIKYKVVDSIDSVKFSVQNAIWDIQDKVAMWKLDKEINNDTFEVEEIEVKPKKKAKKKSAKKTKKSI